LPYGVSVVVVATHFDASPRFLACPYGCVISPQYVGLARNYPDLGTLRGAVRSLGNEIAKNGVPEACAAGVTSMFFSFLPFAAGVASPWAAVPCQNLALVQSPQPLNPFTVVFTGNGAVSQVSDLS
jgi:hypothetical protein